MASQETDGHDSWQLRELEAEMTEIEQGIQSAENAPVINADVRRIQACLRYYTVAFACYTDMSPGSNA